jgi:alpha-mannosidase
VPPQVLRLRGTPDDPTASRHSQDREFVGTRRWWLPPTEVPPIGYCVIVSSQLLERPEEELPVSDDEVVETEWHCLTFDRTQGGIVSWRDKRLGRELVDEKAGWRFASVVYERVADLQHPWARHLLCETRFGAFVHQRGWKPDWRADRWSSQRCLSHQVVQTPIGIEVTQVLEVSGLTSPATVRVRLPFHSPHLEVEAEWRMGMTTHPEATYLAFPFAIPNAIARLDIGGCAMQPEVDQLPGCCRDYFTVQRWVDLGNGEFGVTIACPINPMMQLGDFHFAHNQAHFELRRALFLGWVTNNYWETNFRASQPGKVRACYWLLPHQGRFDEAAAHRFGAEASVPIVWQSAMELPDPNASLPRSAALLTLPEPPILPLHMAPSWAYGDGDGILLRLLNASDRPQRALIGSGLLRLHAAERCDLFGVPQQALPVVDGQVIVALPPRHLLTLRLHCHLSERR